MTPTGHLLMLYSMTTTETGTFHVWDVMYLRAYTTCATRERAERLARDYRMRLGRPFEVRES